MTGTKIPDTFNLKQEKSILVHSFSVSSPWLPSSKTEVALKNALVVESCSHRGGELLTLWWPEDTERREESGKRTYSSRSWPRDPPILTSHLPLYH